MNRGAPKILVLASIFPAVSETFVVDHVLGLVRSGWDVTLAAWHVDEIALAELRLKSDFEVCVHAMDRTMNVSRSRRIGTALCRLLPSYPQGFFSAWVRDLTLAAGEVTELVRQIRPDVIHAHFGPNGITAAFAAKQFGIPLIVNFHGYDVTTVPKHSGWLPYRRLLSHAHAVVHSSFVQERVQAHIAIPVHRVSLGVDATLFQAPPRAGAWSRHIRLLTVGRLVWQKGHHVALEALALLRHQLPERTFSLEICGDGPLRSLLEERACMLNLQDMVSFVGSLAPQAVAKHMADADVLLIPSVPLANGWQEAFCRVAIEGMSMGMVVIGTDTGGLAETIGEGGRIVQPGNASAIASTVADLLEMSSPSVAASIAIGRADSFSIKRMWEQYDEVTHQVYHY